MIEPSVSPMETSSVVFLFPPDVVPLVDVFRALGDFEEHYDVEALDRLENTLCMQVDRAAAKGLVSDALLLAFGLRRERLRPLAYAPLRARQGTRDEYLLVSLIAAAYWHDFLLASEAAAALDLFHAQPLISRAFDIAARLEGAGIRLPMPNARLFARTDESRVATDLLPGDDRPTLRRGAPSFDW